MALIKEDCIAAADSATARQRLQVRSAVEVPSGTIFAHMTIRCRRPSRNTQGCLAAAGVPVNEETPLRVLPLNPIFEAEGFDDEAVSVDVFALELTGRRGQGAEVEQPCIHRTGGQQSG